MVDFTLLAAAAEAVAEHAEEPSAWGFGPGAWVALSMVAVICVMLYVKVPAIIAGMLDKHIGDIREQLDSAAKLRAEAEALKVEFEKKIRDAARDAEKLKAAAEDEAKAIVAKAKEDATTLIARRAQSAEDKIAAAERTAIADLRAMAADAATAAARGLIADNHDAKADASLVDETIAAI